LKSERNTSVNHHHNAHLLDVLADLASWDLLAREEELKVISLVCWYGGPVPSLMKVQDRNSCLCCWTHRVSQELNHQPAEMVRVIHGIRELKRTEPKLFDENSYGRDAGHEEGK
jgi:hypothetical protein